MSTIKNYLSLVRFSHTIFAMPFAFIGFFLGIKAPIGFWTEANQWNINGKTALTNGFNGFIFNKEVFIQLLLVIICMITARSAAMAFNRYLDRAFDAKNPRTAIREIPRGIISAGNALRFTVVCCVLFVVTAYFINFICFLLSPVALFVVLFYSYTKRFTPLCHLVLGLGLSLAPIGAYLAVKGRFDVLPLLFSFAVIFWVSGFDVIYAMQDVDFDKKERLYSIPAAFGKRKGLQVSQMLHFLSALCVISAGIYGHFHFIYWIGIAVFVGMLVYQHSLVSPTDLSKVNIAFMTANGIASVVFSALVIGDLLFF